MEWRGCHPLSRWTRLQNAIEHNKLHAIEQSCSNNGAKTFSNPSSTYTQEVSNKQWKYHEQQWNMPNKEVGNDWNDWDYKGKPTHDQAGQKKHWYRAMSFRNTNVYQFLFYLHNSFPKKIRDSPIISTGLVLDLLGIFCSEDWIACFSSWLWLCWLCYSPPKVDGSISWVAPSMSKAKCRG